MLSCKVVIKIGEGDSTVGRKSKKEGHKMASIVINGLGMQVRLTLSLALSLFLPSLFLPSLSLALSLARSLSLLALSLALSLSLFCLSLPRSAAKPTSDACLPNRLIVLHSPTTPFSG